MLDWQQNNLAAASVSETADARARQSGRRARIDLAVHHFDRNPGLVHVIQKMATQDDWESRLIEPALSWLPPLFAAWESKRQALGVDDESLLAFVLSDDCNMPPGLTVQRYNDYYASKGVVVLPNDTFAMDHVERFASLLCSKRPFLYDSVVQKAKANAIALKHFWSRSEWKQVYALALFHLLQCVYTFFTGEHIDLSS